MTIKASCQDLSLSFKGEDRVLQNISTSFDAGKVTAIIGSSGCGKSTLLRCFNRLVEPTAGRVFFDGVDITTLEVKSLRRKVGILFQHAALFEGSIADNIQYGPKLVKKHLSITQIIELLKLAGLGAEFATKDARNLSIGQGQRVALARMLANEPQMLLLDEPTSALDPETSQLIEANILKLRDEKGITVVWVTHSQDQLARIADNVIIMQAGRILKAGSYQEVFPDNSDFRSIVGNLTPSNELRGSGE